MPSVEYELIPRDNAPENAGFSLCISDDCMAPYISAGARVYVCTGETPAEFDAGIFMYNGRVLCRQWCEDYTGTLHLLCANPARQGENISIPPQARDTLVCLGRVLPDAPLPRP